MPREKQKEMLAFGMRAEVLPQVAMLYAPETQMRLDAVKALAEDGGVDDAHVSELLAKGIDDPEQVVYLAAMEGVWDRPATDAVVDALWSRAVTAQFATYRPSVQAVPETVSFRGVAVGVQSTADNGLYERRWTTA